jgi:protein-disulfide isomerase
MTPRTMRPVLTLPVSDRDHVVGPATAEATLVEYGDYQCPYCLEAYWILLDLQQRLHGRMRLVFRNFPLTTVHPDAQLAAEAAEAAGAQGKFWEMHDYLYEHQDRLDEEALFDYARDVGLNVDRFARDLAAHAFAGRVREDFLSGVRSGVNGTPTFFIDGVRHDASWDLETLTAALLAAAAERGAPVRA